MLHRGKGAFPEPSKSDRTSAGGKEWEEGGDLGGGIKNKYFVRQLYFIKKKSKDSRGQNKHRSTCQVIRNMGGGKVSKVVKIDGSSSERSPSFRAS